MVFNLNRELRNLVKNAQFVEPGDHSAHRENAWTLETMPAVVRCTLLRNGRTYLLVLSFLYNYVDPNDWSLESLDALGQELLDLCIL